MLVAFVVLVPVMADATDVIAVTRELYTMALIRVGGASVIKSTG